MLTPLPAQANILQGDPVEQLVKLLSWEPQLQDTCGQGCLGGCPGYAKLFGNGPCDARCVMSCESKIPAHLQLSHQRLDQGFRPICPCRTVRVSGL
jgi:hypothetical protein